MGLREEYEKRNVDAINKQNETERKIRIVSSLPFMSNEMSNYKKEYYYDRTIRWELPSEIQELLNEAISLIQSDKWRNPTYSLTEKDFIDRNANSYLQKKYHIFDLSVTNLFRCRWSDGSEHISYFHYHGTTDEIVDTWFLSAKARVLKKVNNDIERTYQVVKHMLVPNQKYVCLGDDNYLPKIILFKDGACFGADSSGRNNAETINEYLKQKDKLLDEILKLNHSRSCNPDHKPPTSYELKGCFFIYDDGHFGYHD